MQAGRAGEGDGGWFRVSPRPPRYTQCNKRSYKLELGRPQLSNYRDYSKRPYKGGGGTPTAWGGQEGMHAGGSDAASAPRIHPLPRFPHKTAVPWSLSPPQRGREWFALCTLGSFTESTGMGRNNLPVVAVLRATLQSADLPPALKGSCWRTHHLC